MQKYFLISILLLAASVALVILLIFPLYDQVTASKASIAEKEEIITELNYLIQKIDQWRSQIGEREASMEKLDLALPSDKAIPDFTVSLRSLTESSGIILNDIAIQAGEKVSVASNKDDIGAFNVILDINGTYPAFKLLLSGLEKNIRVADVQSIKFEPTLESNSSILNFIINLKVYYNK